jgi:hypothetical protein
MALGSPQTTEQGENYDQTPAARPTTRELFRTYVASDGNDANNCSLPTPCRLLPAALAAVLPGGEIWMLDSANFNSGNVLINKTVSILAIPGQIGSVVANNADAITVSGAGIKVVLRHLRVVNLAGASNNGVTFSAGSQLTIQDTEFLAIPQAAVNIAAAGSRTHVMRSQFRQNGFAVQVSTGIVNVLNNDFIGNGTVIRAFGNGGSGTFPPNGTTRVRIGGGGTIQDNTTVFNMIDPGTPRMSGQCNSSNIFVNLSTTLEMGNTTRIAVSGIQDHNAGCTPPNEFTIDSWGSPTP